MGLKDTGKVNDEATAGVGRGQSISRSAGDTGPVNPNATPDAGRGYGPVRLGARAIAEETRYNKTVVKITPRVDPVVGGVGGTAGAFFTMRTITDDADPAGDTGDIVLQGGMVTAGTGNSSVADILLFDASVGAEGEWQGTAGQFLILTIEGDGQETSGILDPVFNGDGGAITATSETTLPSNVVPEHGALPGTCILMLGTFGVGGFSPSTPGNFQINFCWGGFNVTRT